MTRSNEAQAWLDEYEGIYTDYLSQVEAAGVALAAAEVDDQEKRELLDRVAAKGAEIRNGGASVCVNGLSTACVACTGDAGSQTFFYSLKCPRNCYFCFNCNQEDYEFFLTHDRDWAAEMDELQRQGKVLTHIGLTGGEPLLDPEKTLAFLHEAHKRWPHAHIRLYTSGWNATDELLQELVDAGLNEIRFSIKLDEGAESYAEVMRQIRTASAIEGLDTMVEMPVIPGTLEAMEQLLLDLDEAGAYGINLLEFCYPQGPWDEFGRRGFEVRNPPFPVLYNWGYAGGLPIAGSELDCLRLVEFALDHHLRLSVHYCSLENKHRDQVLSQNRKANVGDPYELDPQDFYYKTIKVFGDDALALRTAFEQEGVEDWDFDDSDTSLSLPPRMVTSLPQGDRDLFVSYNVIEPRSGSYVLRELALKEY